MLTRREPCNIVVAGVGGQGNVLVARLLAEMMMRSRLIVTVGETYGASQRGGSVMSHVRIARRGALGPLLPAGGADLVIGLEPGEALRVLALYGHPGIVVVTNVRPIPPLVTTGAAAAYPAVESLVSSLRGLCAALHVVAATTIALGLGDPVVANAVTLGAVGALGLLPFGRGDFEAVARAVFPPTRLALNLAAYDAGAAQVVPG